MTSRGRENNEVANRGTWSRFGATFGSSETWIKNQNGITDWPGKGQGDCQPLSVWHYSIDGGIINMKPGQTQQSNIGWFVDYWSTAIATSGQPSYPLSILILQRSRRRNMRRRPLPEQIRIVLTWTSFRMFWNSAIFLGFSKLQGKP